MFRRVALAFLEPLNTTASTEAFNHFLCGVRIQFSVRAHEYFDIQMAYNYHGSMGILTVRLTADEERLLSKRSRGAGMKKATFVRQLIREEPFATGGDVARDAESRMGDVRLRISGVRARTK